MISASLTRPILFAVALILFSGVGSAPHRSSMPGLFPAGQLTIGADAAAIQLTLSAPLTLPRAGDGTAPAYNVTLNTADVSAMPIMCNGAISGLNFRPTGTLISGLRFTAINSCVIGDAGVTFRDLNVSTSADVSLTVRDTQLIFAGTKVAGPVRLTATSVTNTTIALRGGALAAISDCSIIAEGPSNPVAVFGFGIAASGLVESSTVEVTDSTVSCNDFPSAGAAMLRGGAFLSSAVGVVGVASAAGATDAAVVLSNASVNFGNGFDWLQVGGMGGVDTLVGAAGIAAKTLLRANVTARGSTVRAAVFLFPNCASLPA
jgi:hypothetical protein